MGKPEFDLGKAPLHRGDNRELFAIERTKAQNHRMINERPFAQLNHRGIRVIRLGASVSQAGQGVAHFGSGGCAADKKRPAGGSRW